MRADLTGGSAVLLVLVVRKPRRLCNGVWLTLSSRKREPLRDAARHQFLPMVSGLRLLRVPGCPGPANA